MKNRIKLFIIISAIILLFDMKANAQIFDGITQPTKFRVWVPVSIGSTSSNTEDKPYTSKDSTLTSSVWGVDFKTAIMLAVKGRTSIRTQKVLLAYLLSHIGSTKMLWR